ncbi:MAG TPA: 23S rRNA (pseudouridine(1915)-N(3))-methyltransferase RlmH [Polyangia bacterium]
MKLLVRAVGKMRDRRLEDVCREYVDRVKRHLPVDIGEVESDAGLLRGLPPGTEIIALEPGGDAWDTPAFTAHINRQMNAGTKALAFLIGGADGLSAEVVAKAHRRLSLSPLTLPHRLARVLLCEQLYRAVSKIRGEPYDR